MGANLDRVLKLFVYIFIIGDPIINRMTPLTGLISPYFCACPKSGDGFPTPYIVFLLVFNALMDV